MYRMPKTNYNYSNSITCSSELVVPKAYYVASGNNIMAKGHIIKLRSYKLRKANTAGKYVSHAKDEL